MNEKLTWTEIDDIVCDIEDLRYNSEKASEVAVRVKELFKRVKDIEVENGMER